MAEINTSFNYTSLPYGNHYNTNGGGSTLMPDENLPGQNPTPNPGEGNGENEDEYTPPDNDGGFGKAVRRLDV